MSTAPRPAPVAPLAQQPPLGMRVAPAPRAARESTRGQRSKSKMPYVIIILVLVAAGVAAALVAMSGPDVAVKEK
jgi:hypothetical protein